jgi:hypothetical protein
MQARQLPRVAQFRVQIAIQLVRVLSRCKQSHRCPQPLQFLNPSQHHQSSHRPIEATSFGPIHRHLIHVLRRVSNRFLPVICKMANLCTLKKGSI